MQNLHGLMHVKKSHAKFAREDICVFSHRGALLNKNDVVLFFGQQMRFRNKSVYDVFVKAVVVHVSFCVFLRFCMGRWWNFHAVRCSNSLARCSLSTFSFALPPSSSWRKCMRRFGGHVWCGDRARCRRSAPLQNIATRRSSISALWSEREQTQPKHLVCHGPNC